MEYDLLEIPAFLKRSGKRRGRPRKIIQTQYKSILTEGNWTEWDKIKIDKYGDRYDIVLNDEFPRIGSGYRTIYVLEKRKWVFIVSHEGDPDETQPTRVRTTKKKWADLKRSNEKFLERNKKV